MAYKPTGYSSVSPYLIVTDAAATLAFLATVFNAERLRVHHREDGSILHAEARIDDTVVMMGQMPEGQPANVHVYVADVDAAFARAVAAGGTVIQAVEAKDDGDRRGGIADPNGIVWWLATEEGPQ